MDILNWVSKLGLDSTLFRSFYMCISFLNKILVLIIKTILITVTPILWWPDVKRNWCWERLKAGGEGDDRRWDGWMTSLTRWTWVWVNSRSWWWTGRSGMLQSMGSQRVRHDWAIELNWIIVTATVNSYHLLRIITKTFLNVLLKLTKILNNVATLSTLQT